jgi:hypothetical protein
MAAGTLLASMSFFLLGCPKSPLAISTWALPARLESASFLLAAYAIVIEDENVARHMLLKSSMKCSNCLEWELSARYPKAT